MNRQIFFNSLTIFFILICSCLAFSQVKSEDLNFSIVPISSVNNSVFPKETSFRLRIENKFGKTIRFNSQVIKLHLKPFDAVNEDCSKTRCYFGFVKTPIKNKKIKNNESIEVETQIDDRHWYYGLAQTWVPSNTPNLFEYVRSGEFQLTATIEIQSEKPNPSFNFKMVFSNPVKISI